MKICGGVEDWLKLGSMAKREAYAPTGNETLLANLVASHYTK